MKNQKIVNDISGVITLDKESGYTSNDCLSLIKKIIHPRKIGHTGTLDVNATGVLVCLLGDATKCQEYLMEIGDKIYDAELILGFSTDTEDYTGKIIDISPSLLCESISNEKSEKFISIYDDVKSVVKSFIGDYSQVPPMYSAKKINGKKLINLAHKGEVIDRKACVVRIKNIEVNGVSKLKLNYNDDEIIIKTILLRVVCSKGTYIRTLCKDIGERLGIPACMGNLRRLEAGNFNIKDSVKISEIEKKVLNGDYSFVKPCFYSWHETVVTFGKFETLHLGHQSIIKKVVTIAKDYGISSTVIIVGNNSDNEILTKAQRISKLKYMGVDSVLNYKLEYNNINISPEYFVEDVLVKQLKARVIVVGSDCRFGYMGKGDSKLLNEICNKYNVKVIVVDKLKNDDGSVISSTLIYNEHSKGNNEFVNNMLGR